MSRKKKPFRPPLKEPEISDHHLWNVARDLTLNEHEQIDQLMAELGSPPPYMIWNPTEEQFLQKKLIKLLSWWNQTRGKRIAPEPEEVDPIELSKSLGNLIINDVVDEGKDFHTRLFGTLISDNVQDLTGERLSDIWTPLRHFFMMNYRAICLRPEPLYSRHTPALEISTCGWDRLILPLVKDGKVTRILIGIYECKRQAPDGSLNTG